jgi:hypothetical protein
VGQQKRDFKKWMNEGVNALLYASKFNPRAELMYKKLASEAGLSEGIFSSQNPNLGTFWRDMQLKMLV